MKRYFTILLGLVIVAVAVTVAFRMTSDAMAVIVGIILGMFATLPTSLILLYMVRQQNNEQVDPKQQQMSQYPPVVVVNSSPNGYGAGMGSANPQALLPALPSERSFKVVGQEASSTESSDKGVSFNSLWDEMT